MQMNLLVTLNSGYLKPLTVMLHSLERSNPDSVFTVYVSHHSHTAQDFAFLRARLDPARIRLKSVEVSDQLLHSAPITYRYPREMYYRLFAARFLPQDLDRILYLDPDLVVIRPLDSLYKMDFGKNLFIAASHVGRSLKAFNELRLDMPENSVPYVNSGVMMMNLELLRQELDEERILRYIQDNRDLLFLPDQDVLNGLYGDRILTVSPFLYNLNEKFLLFSQLKPTGGARINLDWVRRNTVIVHYCGKNKPWKEGYHGELGEFYFAAAGELDLSADPARSLDEITVRPLSPQEDAKARTLLQDRWFTCSQLVDGRLQDLTAFPAYAAWSGPDLVGLVTFTFPEPSVCRLLSLDSLYENQGIGTRLIQAAADHARSQGCRCLQIRLTNDNLDALGFCQRRGFDLTALHRDVMSEARRQIPLIPERSESGIPVRHQLELELPL